MRVGVLRFPGSNCDDDSLHVINRVLGEQAAFVWHKETRLPSGTDAVIVPGGFSYGDYLRAGAIAAQSPIMDAVRAFAGSGGPVLGICNGFQILCEAGLLPGALTRNVSLRFECRQVNVRLEDKAKATPFTSGLGAGKVLRLPIAHAEGRYISDDSDGLATRGQVIFRYCDPAGAVTDAANPNGSQRGIAGVCNDKGNVLALMPHPERAAEAILGEEGGRQMFESLRTHVAGRAGR
jgi:phosphoribosylformylglycinamidine synthase subunit PurQ / glutaminase